MPSLLFLTIVLVLALPLASTAGLARAAQNRGADEVPAGTVITETNWQRYSRFMAGGMQALFAGDHFWRMPADVQIEVDPPSQYHYPISISKTRPSTPSR